MYDKKEIEHYINMFENKLFDTLDKINSESEKVDSDYILIQSLATDLKFNAERLEYWTSKISEEDAEWEAHQAVIDRKSI